MMTNKSSFFTLSKAELKDVLKEWGEKPFRASQIWDHVYKKRSWGFRECSNISKTLIAKLEENYPIKNSSLLVKKTSIERDAKKYLLGFADEADSVEVVALRAPGRGTVCVSSQIGCDMGCKFCASTIDGKKRDLHFSEIVEQFVAAGVLSDWNMTHVVVMGMGEPLLNYDNLIKAVDILTNPDYFGISHRRVTISTIGVVDKIIALSREDIRPSLAISLHAPNQRIRESIIPSAVNWQYDSILNAAEEYQSVTGRQVTLEYCLLDGVNDLKIHAEILGARISGKGFAVNLIPYNQVEGISWERSTPERVERFKETLEKFIVTVTTRREKGADISAACGQLRRKEID